MLKEAEVLGLTKPDLGKEGKNLYVHKPPILEEALRPNLALKVNELVEDGENTFVTNCPDPTDDTQTKDRHKNVQAIDVRFRFDASVAVRAPAAAAAGGGGGSS